MAICKATCSCGRVRGSDVDLVQLAPSLLCLHQVLPQGPPLQWILRSLQRPPGSAERVSQCSGAESPEITSGKRARPHPLSELWYFGLVIRVALLWMREHHRSRAILCVPIALFWAQGVWALAPTDRSQRHFNALCYRTTTSGKSTPVYTKSRFSSVREKELNSVEIIASN